MRGSSITNGNTKIQIILGSTREGRFGETVAKWFYGVAELREDLDTKFIYLRDWPLPFLGDPAATAKGGAERWSEKIAGADGHVIVTPEYNHGYSAVLKNAMDYLNREWNNKPTAR